MVKLKYLTREMVKGFLDGFIESGREIPFKRKSVKYHLLYKGRKFPPMYVVTEILDVNPVEVETKHCVRRLRKLNFEIIEEQKRKE